MQESLPLEHSGELLSDALKQLLDSGRVSDEGGGHLDTTRRNVTNGSLHVVGNPFDEEGRILVLDIIHLLIDCHHVLRVEHLLSEFWDAESSVLLGASGGQRGES